MQTKLIWISITFFSLFFTEVHTIGTLEELSHLHCLYENPPGKELPISHYLYDSHAEKELPITVVVKNQYTWSQFLH